MSQSARELLQRRMSMAMPTGLIKRTEKNWTTHGDTAARVLQEGAKSRSSGVIHNNIYTSYWRHGDLYSLFHEGKRYNREQLNIYIYVYTQNK